MEVGVDRALVESCVIIREQEMHRGSTCYRNFSRVSVMFLDASTILVVPMMCSFRIYSVHNHIPPVLTLNK